MNNIAGALYRVIKIKNEMKCSRRLRSVSRQCQFKQPCLQSGFKPPLNLRLLVLTHYHRVTNRRTDRHMSPIPRSLIQRNATIGDLRARVTKGRWLRVRVCKRNYCVHIFN